MRYRVQPGPPHQPGVPVGAVLLRPEGPVQPQTSIRHVQMRPSKSADPPEASSGDRGPWEATASGSDPATGLDGRGGPELRVREIDPRVRAGRPVKAKTMKPNPQ